MVDWGLIVGIEIGLIIGLIVGAYNFGKLTKLGKLSTKKGDYTFTKKPKEEKK